MKFKIGDYVKIARLGDTLNNYAGGFVGSMENYVGDRGEINACTEYDNSIGYRISGCPFVIGERCLEAVEKIGVGDIVRIRDDVEDGGDYGLVFLKGMRFKGSRRVVEADETSVVVEGLPYYYSYEMITKVGGKGEKKSDDNVKKYTRQEIAKAFLYYAHRDETTNKLFSEMPILLPTFMAMITGLFDYMEEHNDSL